MHVGFERRCSGALGLALGSMEAFEGGWPGEHRPPRRHTHRAPLWSQILQGLFFDDSYGFYPGQVLIGPAKIFSSVQWLSGVKPVLSTKSKFRVVVEEVGTGDQGAGTGPQPPRPRPSCCPPFSACSEG